MNPLSNFLERFKTFLVSSKNIKEAIQSVIHSVASIELKEGEIDIRDGVVVIQSHPATRNAIFMRKKKIIEELQRILGKQAPRDIR